MSGTPKTRHLCVPALFLCVALLSFPVLAAALPAPRSSSSVEYGVPEQETEAVSPEAMPFRSGSQEYVLDTGDKIRLTVFGEADLSGDYEVGSTGVIALPLIGDVRAAGQSITSFEKAVRAKLSQGYLRDPRVSAQVVNYRPFFILGEVSKPGSYPYVNGMTVLNAVALAGGYTYRADKKDVTITKAGDPQKKPIPAPEEMAVMPGDIIRVPERFF